MSLSDPCVFARRGERLRLRGAAFLTSSYGVHIILRYHQQNYWVMTIANFIFFFYLIRPEILRRLR